MLSVPGVMRRRDVADDSEIIRVRPDFNLQGQPALISDEPRKVTQSLSCS